MEAKTNIAEILKDCPRGMELDCSMYEDVYFDYVDELNIIHCHILHTTYTSSLTFNQYGTPNSDIKSKCVIFPKGKTTWEGFVPPFSFKDGDIVATTNGLFVGIVEVKNNKPVGAYCSVDYVKDFRINSDYVFDRLATSWEKEKLFRAIKDNGYHWNAETKTLEKLSVPSTPEKFYIRIGEIPSDEKSSVHRGDAVVGYEDGVSVYDCVETDGLYRIVMPFPLKEGQGMTYECLIQEITQCRYEIENPRNVYLVSGIEVGKGHDNEPVIKDVKILKDLTEQFNTKNDNTEETKTLEKLIEPKFKVGDRIIKRDSIVNSWTASSVSSKYYGLKSPNSSECIGVMSTAGQDDWELVPNKFDISTLKPFDKVLVRHNKDNKWCGSFFSHIDGNFHSHCYKFVTIAGKSYPMCIPYEGNEHLLGTTNDCIEYYKTWKE